MPRDDVVARRNGGVSFWYANTQTPAPRPGLAGDCEADVCIVGAGFTGLWTAYELKRAAPQLRVVVLERAFAGYGASGRNGGWLSAQFAASREQMAKTHGRDAVLALQQGMRDTVDEVIAVCAREEIDADVVKHGLLRVARTPAQRVRLAAAVAQDRAWGAGEDDLLELDAPALAARVDVADGLAGSFTPHCARVQPAKLVQGLARAVERLGVEILEDTAVLEVRPGAAICTRGTVRARHVLRCLEGFTPSLRGQRRTWLPLNSAMVVTAPLSESAWASIGWARAELLGDSAHAYVYAQRTADGRIALGGRGVPYRFGSRTDVDGQTQQRTIGQLVGLLHALFPAARDAAIDHAWCGVLGVPRDWSPTVSLDPQTGLGLAGGYVGHGVATANLAGRTLCDLVLGHDTPRTQLPWVGHRARRWEPEPLRYVGAQLVYGLYRGADRREARRGTERTSRLARAADLLSGRRAGH
jgi:glycine/D-amino acid oxidase-like deaminating enzyme